MKIKKITIEFEDREPAFYEVGENDYANFRLENELFDSVNEFGHFEKKHSGHSTLTIEIYKQPKQ